MEGAPAITHALVWRSVAAPPSRSLSLFFSGLCSRGEARQFRLVLWPAILLVPIISVFLLGSAFFPSGKKVGCRPTWMLSMQSASPIRSMVHFCVLNMEVCPGTRGGGCETLCTILKLYQDVLNFKAPVGWAETDLSVCRYPRSTGGLFVHWRYLESRLRLGLGVVGEGLGSFS